ncbi:hypothetical protein [Acidithiobacillus ferriphilus]|uniref:hypothetical protein n=1 Tax=Acidithiobacillus ferriphilus TaxID=1689834 RepID=UPI00232AD520|nr:hypothetical protein [Acidithiobacillus ferriphilus]WCE92994.1 hypothetical protein PJU76_08455 [Acidithiobacillus ferriphilus]
MSTNTTNKWRFLLSATALGAGILLLSNPAFADGDGWDGPDMNLSIGVPGVIYSAPTYYRAPPAYYYAPPPPPRWYRRHEYRWHREHEDRGWGDDD